MCTGFGSTATPCGTRSGADVDISTGNIASLGSRCIASSISVPSCPASERPEFLLTWYQNNPDSHFHFPADQFFMPLKINNQTRKPYVNCLINQG
jgi:hypothetical protein